MDIYLILPDYHTFSKFERYFKKVIEFTDKSKNSFNLCAEVLNDYKYVLGRQKGQQVSNIVNNIKADDIVFNFTANEYFTDSNRYFHLDPATLECSLYSCLLVTNIKCSSFSFIDFPVELMSELWFENLHRPSPDLRNYDDGSETIYLNANHSSHDRAWLSYRNSEVSSDRFLFCLEGILLGKKVSFPGMPISSEAAKNYYLSNRLLPSSVLTDTQVFEEFIGNVGRLTVSSNILLELHHKSLMKNVTVPKYTRLQKKLRKLKRDPVLFISDALKKLFR